MQDEPLYFRYWGKASPDTTADSFHLLPFHSMDVAACGKELIALRQFSLQPLAQELMWPLSVVERLFIFFLALHDLGKFATAFQGLVPNLSPDLVPPNEEKQYTRRHDTLGWILWCEEAPALDCLPDGSNDFWAVWIRSVVGHHGKPPQESEGGGLIGQDANEFFMRADRRAARAFIADVAPQLLPADVPMPSVENLATLQRHTWRLAGLSVLADWLGSNRAFYPYHSAPSLLSEYWPYAQEQARQAVVSAGLKWQPARNWPRPLELFDYLKNPTPLQEYAATVDLELGPQLFLLEDVTGAGKTEAALILAQRLMQADRAHGVYFALPSMATANQMYQRVGSVYRRLYTPDAQPSLILAHGARQLVEGFRQSVLPEQLDDHGYQTDESSASLHCNAWLADNRKKALLAEVGVGTLDQALLAILPARHQSLRLLGLAGKILIVDEVHAYDSYMVSLLKTLLVAHARQGGSVILLSATLPLTMREELLAHYRYGLGINDETCLDDRRYPLAVRAGREIQPHACETRPQVRRQVQIRALNDEAAVLELIAELASKGHCIAWIRNTVDDARRAHRLLSESLPEDSLMLFHSRYAMADRLDIEADVLARFGKHSRGAEREGRVLIGTQVLEQSLDFDVDVMVSDLAPTDLLIQRAGRLQRHARQVDGNIAEDGIERREAPMLWLLMPDPGLNAEADWYSALFPKGCFVYPDAGKLWLGARALLRAGCIITPGEPDQVGSVRQLVESVYGEDTEEIPDALRKASREQQGKDLAMQSQAHFNSLKLNKGYCIDSSDRWYEDHQIPTRLGDETLTLYLAIWREDGLHPLRDDNAHCWEQSAVRINASHAESLTPEWEKRFGPAIEQLRSKWRLLEEPAFVLPLAEVDDRWVARVQDKHGREREMRYDRRVGLSW